MQQRDPARSRRHADQPHASRRRLRRAQFTVPYGDIAAAVVVTVPVMVLVLRFQRPIVAGLTARAVKG